MDIGGILNWQFPGMENEGFKVGQDADGNPRISYWDEGMMGRPKPTLLELEAWELPYTKYNRRKQIKVLSDVDYDAVFSINGQVMDMFKDELLVSIAVARMGGPALSTQEAAKRDQAATVRTKARNKIQAINSVVAGSVVNGLSDVEQVQAITWS